MVVERTHYFAKPGRIADVLHIRRKASAVRVRLGLPAGAIFTKEDPAADGPDVAWECGFPGPEEHDRDLLARAESPEFAAVRREMQALIARFERHIVRLDAGAPAAAHEVVPLDTGPIVPVEVRFRSGAHELAGYLYTPPGDGPFPCAIVNHGSTIHQGTTDVCRPGTAALLLSWGYAAFLPHRHGYGNSSGPAWRSEVTAEFGTPEYDARLAARLARESADVAAAAGLLATRPEIDAGRLAVMGSSFGGTVTLLAAAASDRFRCALDFAGAAMNWERTPTLREAMRAAAREIMAPICLVQAANDYSVAPTRELAAELERLGKPHQARVFPAFGLTPDEGHGFFANGPLVWGGFVHEFLDQWMR